MELDLIYAGEWKFARKRNFWGMRNGTGRGLVLNFATARHPRQNATRAPRSFARARDWTRL